MLPSKLKYLAASLKGDLYIDDILRRMYATDASVYREIPLAVAIPKDEEDIIKIINFSRENNTHIIPRAAGTSLGGQCVGTGIVVDVSKYFTEIIEVNTHEQWVRVQPGVIRDELNKYLEPLGFFFSPNTSTANRCTIAGMVGNNSSGSTSIEYGVTRNHVIQLNTILSDGSSCTFKKLEKTELEEKTKLNSLEGTIYSQLHSSISQMKVRDEIRKEFPKANIHRRNTGYAVDYLANSSIYNDGDEEYNLCNLLCGSEGTLAFTTEIKLHIDPLPAEEVVIIAAHFDSIHDSLLATQIAMKYKLSACELMDKIILDCTKDNAFQSKNRFFLEGDPKAILILEIRDDKIENVLLRAEEIIEDLKGKNLGYSYPLIRKEHVEKVWSLRKAGLGLLANIPGDKKAVACIEDTAVDIDDLPSYIAEFTELMKDYGQESVYYAHAGAGEIHLRPILNLKKSEDVQKFADISKSVSELVKKYGGSLSGEHGDGRVRSPFIKDMIGERINTLFKDIKYTWDPDEIFNIGKIVDPAPITASLRYKQDEEEKSIDSLMDFSASGGILRMAEKCNGSGDCRKTHLSSGVMCPSYQASKDEMDSTRARANILREYLSNSNDNPYNQKEIKEVLDLCLSCKACSTECPSNVDITSMKAEFLHQYQKVNGTPLRSKLFANYGSINNIASKIPTISNFFIQNRFTSGIFKSTFGIAKKRSLPKLQKTTLRKWFDENKSSIIPKKGIISSVYLFCDEFTNYGDSGIGIKAVKLLSQLGYEVKMIDHSESGRAHLSKGLLEQAQKYAKENVSIFKDIINNDTPLIGIEPSAILTFRDEYPKLVDSKDIEKAKVLGENAMMIDEFIAREIEAGNIKKESFAKDKKEILLHGHCHQKALSEEGYSEILLSFPENYSVKTIESGCCGMAGSFGYEKEHYDMSMKVGELVLFPTIRKSKSDSIIAAPGTSCRHQIKDGVSRDSMHPVEVLFGALL